ncbi:regulatory signaling modulator protein AmpE [Thalassolituus oleivorans]|uniref:regulatory signaling modulator protein AmpE n=1 Tax=Thalassolituus oleivorans TaxID=187493 RepID=UPI0030C8706A
MKFLIVFIVLMMQARLPLPQRSTRSRSFNKWLQLCRKLPKFAWVHRHVRYTLVVIVPTVAISAAFFWAEHWAWGLGTVLLEILLLTYVLSHISIGKHLADYRHDLSEGDTQGAYHCAEQFLAVPEVTVTDDISAMNEQVIRALLHRWFEYFFLMVFWYMVADVAGVLLAWFSVQYARAQECDDRAWRYLHWLEWGPVRLLGLTYGLAGNFMRALPVWRQQLWQLDAHSADILFNVASSALSANGEQRRWHKADENAAEAARDLDEWHSLHLRSVSIWMVVIAIAAVGGVLL